MIFVSDISKAYSDKKDVINDLSFGVKSGETVAILGKNGTGKTTLLECLVKSKFRDSGAVTYNGRNLDNFDSRYHYYYIPSDRGLFSNLTFEEYLLFVKHLYRSSVDVSDIIEKLELEQYMHHKLSMCSYGTKQKMFIVGSIISGADNILMDEPFNGIDVESCLTLVDCFNKLKNIRKSIVYTSNQLDYILDTADNVFFMRENDAFEKYIAKELTMEKIKMMYR